MNAATGPDINSGLELGVASGGISASTADIPGQGSVALMKRECDADGSHRVVPTGDVVSVLSGFSVAIKDGSHVFLRKTGDNWFVAMSEELLPRKGNPND